MDSKTWSSLYFPPSSYLCAWELADGIRPKKWDPYLAKVDSVTTWCLYNGISIHGLQSIRLLRGAKYCYSREHWTSKTCFWFLIFIKSLQESLLISVPNRRILLTMSRWRIFLYFSRVPPESYVWYSLRTLPRTRSRPNLRIKEFKSGPKDTPR